MTMTQIKQTYPNGAERTLTVQTAAYSNGEHSAIVLHTEEAGQVAIAPGYPAGVWEQVQASGIAISPYAPSVEEIMAAYEAAVQRHMDASARTAGYDDIKTAVTYADEPAVAKFQQEGQAFRAWRSLCWAYCYEQLAAVQAGQRPQPTVEELLGELPTLLLPAV